MANMWYIIAKEDKKSQYGYTTITPKGEFYLDIEEAERDRIYLQPDYDEKLVILKRTCEVV